MSSLGPYDEPRQRREAAELGVWVFLLTEVMFFGGLFAAYAVYRYWHPAAFAEGSAGLDLALGTGNTAILLTSSLAMALAVRAASHGETCPAAAWLAATALLGLVFMGVKAVEWAHKAEAGLFPGRFGEIPGGLVLFFNLYYAMTGLHALHVAIGIGLIGWVAAQALRGRFSAEYYAPLEGVGLYWHFVDIVWIFLFPLLYLTGRGS